MTVTSASEARANFQELINRAEYRGDRIVIQRHGKPVAAIIGLEDLKLLEAIEDAIDSAELRRAVEENDGFTTLDAIIAKRGNE
ncbi:MAG: type II toxin-antitoxin system Phd/YefM family antitoxin [Mojavia pulchra JT2-VF2]|jgi:prevent-host-death family protein|uniref:Antitoxin n=1 Tax=Mojavia pulchra JT2-VF2 TaxID=287848 RepID=A0A951PUM5_9NOST|nr:type II toxin-antitoxin system Phd/YefM family antitoxin [Mojavia pulchra JT2-VF2]